MKTIAMVCAVWLACSSAFAGAREEKAAELMGLLNIQETMQQSFAMTKKMMVQQTEQMARGLGQSAAAPQMRANQEKILDLISSEMTWDKIRDDFVLVYAEIFTEDELQSLVDFYKTPAGRAFVEKQPLLMQRTMELNQKMMMRVMPKLQQMMKDMKAGMSAPEAPKAAE